MCGICGYVGDHRPELLEPMALAMVHRGPDDMGTWHSTEGQVGLGHRRLSILDLSPAGHQPMSTPDGRYWITYNGEIYNFQEHRERFEKQGMQLRGHSDTEVILALFAEKGPACLDDLNGIFALAIWDTHKRELFLARDHAGIKPLYYMQDGRRLFFASEIKALLKIPEIPRRLNHEALDAYLTFLWVPGEETMLEGIMKVEPGHWLTWRDGRIETRQWFHLAYEPDYSLSEDAWVDATHDTFLRATRRQMVSDVPLGAFLSGGLDSSSIVACMREAFPQREINCYTVKLRPGDMRLDQFEDDYPHAQRVADHLGVRLKAVELGSEVISLLPKLIYHLDEPDADAAIFPSYLISKLAREDGTTVLLSGTGGDEIFFGYRSHQALRRLQAISAMPRWLTAPLLAAAASVTRGALGAHKALPRRLAKFSNLLSRNGIHRHMALSDWSSDDVRARLYSRELSSALAGCENPPASMRRYYNEFQGRGELNRRSHVLIQTFLASHNFLYTDKTSMAASVEARVPFLDVELMRLAARMPEDVKLKGQTTKYVLKRAMERYLPREVIYRSKTGFGAPLRKWINEDLDAEINDLLGEQRVGHRGLFDAGAITQVLRDNRAGKADHTYLLYALLTLEVWMQTFIDQAGSEVSLNVHAR
ncbi:MAG: asparagine synthase (glutamine-hydrolyzing) [Planctomycetes bacterium UTPLA1]|nr:MAG: asparagine synthase (glutamine-hydrolyzing) [Planctomycetes bacterium UTPLA1]